MGTDKETMPGDHVFQRWLDHGRISAERINVIALVEIATLAGWYVACENDNALAAGGALLLGTFVVVMFYSLIEMDMHQADQWRKLYEERHAYKIAKLPFRQRWLIRSLAWVLIIVNVAAIGGVLACGC